MAYGDGDRGVGGWLAFFLVTLGIFTPLATIIGVAVALNDPAAAAVLGPAWTSLRNGEIVLTVLTVGLCWFACWRFLSVFNWTTVKIGIATLWSLVALSVIGEPLVVSMVTGIDLGLLMREMGFDLIRPFFYGTIWTLYLLKSMRVRNTYSGEAVREEMAEVFN